MILLHRPDNAPRFVQQIDHAEGAGQLAQQWQRPADWPEAIWQRFVEAVHRHDDGWRELETAPALDPTGRPYSFKNLPTDQHVAVWQRGIDEQAAQDPYRGLVLALHAHWLYTQLARNEDEAEEAAAQQFLNWVDQRIDELVQQLSEAGPAEQHAVAPNQLDLARRLIGFFDMISLILLGALEVNDWPEPLPFGEHCESLRIHLPHGSPDLAIEPWPFVDHEVRVTVPAYDLDEENFESPERLGQQLQQTDPLKLQYTIRPGDYDRL
jgi:hypothetical protein